MAASLIQPDQSFALWAILLSAATIGIWGEKTKWGAKLSGAVITMLVTFVLSNLFIIPIDSPTYSAVWSFLVPFSLPLLLFQADLSRILRESGPTLIAYCLGAIGTVLGTLLAYFLLPLGEAAWKLAGVFCATYIGGSVNFFTTAQTLDLDLASGDLLAAGTAADNLVMTLFFLILFALPSIHWLQKFFPSRNLAHNPNTANEANPQKLQKQPELTLMQMSQALAISAVVCAAGAGISNLLGWPKTAILISTVLIVGLATGFPRYFSQLTVAEKMGTLLMQIFFGVIGASTLSTFN